MDLKDVIGVIYAHVDKAHKAFHAGKRTVSNGYLRNLYEELRRYFNEMSPDDVAALQETTSEKETEAQTEKPAEVPGAQAQPAASQAAAAAQTVGRAPCGERRTQ